MHVDNHEPFEKLKRLAKREPEANVARRLQALVLARHGKTAEQIAEATSMCRRSVQSWVARYNAGGVDALRGTPHPGKPPKLSPPQQRELCEKLDAGADYDRDGLCALRGQDVRRFIEERFGVVYHLGNVYKLLTRLGYSSLKPRPRHKKADPEAQRRWLEDAPLFCNKSNANAPTRSSASGTTTKRVSASRER